MLNLSLKSIGCGLLTFENKHSPDRKARVAYAIGKQKKNAMNEIPSLMITYETISGVRTTEKVAFPPPSLISWNINNQTNKKKKNTLWHHRASGMRGSVDIQVCVCVDGAIPVKRFTGSTD